MKYNKLIMTLLSLMAVMIFIACERDTVLEYESIDAEMSLRFSEKMTNSRAEFTGKITIKKYSHDMDGAEDHEVIKIMDLNIVQKDTANPNIYTVVDNIEVPYDEELIISINANLGEEDYTGETFASFTPGQSAALVIDMVEVVDETQTPYCTITSPTEGENITLGEQVNIFVDASPADSTGYISFVEFHVNNVAVGTSYDEPYEFFWNSTGQNQGAVEIKAIAFDNNYLQTADVVTINLTSTNTPPSCTIDSPSEGDSFTIGSFVNIYAAANDSDGTVEHVIFYINNALADTVLTEPWEYNWNTTGQSQGSYELKAVAVDNNNAETTDVINITLDNSALTTEMILVEGGSFDMGRADGNLNEQPVHNITIRSFHMSKYEVTQTDYEQIIGANPSYYIGADYPVDQVSWYGVLVYCNQKSINDGLAPCYSINGSTDPDLWGAIPSETDPLWNQVSCNFDANGFRMPTEAEWEFAARGGNSSAGYAYSGSNTVENVAWYLDNSGFTAHNVGLKQQNELGICDMSGNAGEWCWDWYDSSYYSSSTNNDPTGPTSGIYRVCRGGNHANEEFYVRPTTRHDVSEPHSPYNLVGIRLVKTAE